jgi:hypothetical protein
MIDALLVPWQYDYMIKANLGQRPDRRGVRIFVVFHHAQRLVADG